MTRHLPWLKPLAAAALLLAAGASQANIVVYTSQADFLAAITGAGTDTFDDLVPGAQAGTGPLTRSAGGISYAVSAGPNSPILYGAGSASDAWLSTNNANDTLTFDNFAAGTYAAGAFVFGSDIGGNSIVLTRITVTATDADGTVSQTLRRTSPSSFIGFVSDEALTSFTVSAVQGIRRTIWPTVNDLTLAAAVPEPATTAMLLAGLGVVGFVAVRRRGD